MHMKYWGGIFKILYVFKVLAYEQNFDLSLRHDHDLGARIILTTNQGYRGPVQARILKTAKYA